MRLGISLILLTGLVLLAATPESSAQWFGAKKPKAPPQQRVPELIVMLKVEKDANKRADAAEELRQYDPKDFPELIPVLVDALQNDSATGVRIEAATSLGRLRPISIPAGQALEKAAGGDANWKVRLQANASLAYYKLSGYHAPKKNEQNGNGPVVAGRTDEPPLIGGGPPPGETWWQNGPEAPKVAPAAASTIYRPLPSGPTQYSTQVPVVTAPSATTQQQPKGQPAIQSQPQLQMPVQQQQGPMLPQAPTIQSPIRPQWAPVQQEGPKLMPPQIETGAGKQ